MNILVAIVDAILKMAAPRSGASDVHPNFFDVVISHYLAMVISAVINEIPMVTYTRPGLTGLWQCKLVTLCQETACYILPGSCGCIGNRAIMDGCSM